MDTSHSWRDSLIIEKIVDSAVSSLRGIDTEEQVSKKEHTQSKTKITYTHQPFHLNHV